MFRNIQLIIVVCASLMSGRFAFAQHGGSGHSHHGTSHHGGAYPLVYGATGRPYGPTQAHYQYQRQYGHPWYGAGPRQYGYGIGAVNGVNVSAYSSSWSFPYLTNSYLYGNPYPYYSGYPVYSSVPVFGFQGYIPGVPSVYSSSAFYERRTIGPQLLNGQITSAPSPANVAVAGLNQPSIARSNLIIQPSTPAAQVQSLHFMAQGDLKLREMNYLAAAERYRQAINVARDLAEPRYRLALTETARSKFLDAVDEFKLAFTLNPRWIEESPSLDDLFGENNLLGKTQIKQRVADWLLQDSRDPNRLFLLGLLLRMDGDDRSQILIDTAIKVAGPEPHLVALMSNNGQPANLEEAPSPAQNQPQPPPEPALQPGNPEIVAPPEPQGPNLPPAQ